MQSVLDSAVSSLAAGFSQTVSVLKKTSPLDEPSVDVLPLLESKLLTKGRSISEFFPHIVRSVASPVPEIRRLVFILLLRGAKQEPDLALMTVNALQKDLSDPNPFHRALSLHVLSCLQVPVIAPLIALSIKKMASDLSPIVRRAAAAAIEPCLRLNSDLSDSLVDTLCALLKDPSPIVTGAAMATLNLTNKFDSLEILDQVYFHLVQNLSSVDDWSKMEVLYGLTKYVRSRFLEPKEKNALHPDHLFLLESCRPLLSCSNMGVIARVTSLYYYTAPFYLEFCIPSLLRLALMSSAEAQPEVLQLLVEMAPLIRSHLTPLVSQFFLLHKDSIQVQCLKLSILEEMDGAFDKVLPELFIYLKSGDDSLTARTIKSLGRVATKQPDVYADKILKRLCRMLSIHKDESVLEESIQAIRSILQCHPLAVPTILPRLIPVLVSSEGAPHSLASIYSLCNCYFPEHPDTIGTWIPDILRLAAKTFPSQTSAVKLQILSLCVKFTLSLGERDSASPMTQKVRGILGYLLEMARFDVDLDVRDRARFLKALLSSPLLANEDARFVTHWIQKSKDSSDISFKKNKREESGFTLGSLSFARKRKLAGYAPLPKWTTSLVPSARGKLELQGAITSNGLIPQPPPLPSTVPQLDDFYSESSSEEESFSQDDDEEEDDDDEEEEDDL